MTTTVERLGKQLDTVGEDDANYRWVYLWHWPIRAMHWSAALSIVVLIATGFYIGKPYFMTSGEASEHYLMGWMRFWHFAAAGVLVATAMVRFYWLFAGSKFENWRALFPITGRDCVNTIRIIKKYLMIRQKKEPHYLGHNPYQQFFYTGIYVTALLQVLTGFALYGLSNPGGWFYQIFGWQTLFLGGVPVVRFIHHLVAWVFLVFMPIHIYLALRTDVMERTGTLSSIFSGGKWMRDDVDYEDE